MSKRLRLVIDSGVGQVDVGWAEITPNGQILEVMIEEPVVRMSTERRKETRCTSCSLNLCIGGVYTDLDCLCCKFDHGRKQVESEVPRISPPEVNSG